MALEDRELIMAHVGADNPVAAIKLDLDFEGHAVRACAEPALYKPGRVKGTREIVVRPNYVMIYRVTSAAVVILRVLHAAQQWPPSGRRRRASLS